MTDKQREITVSEVVRGALVQVHSLDNRDRVHCLPSCNWVSTAHGVLMVALQSPALHQSLADRLSNVDRDEMVETVATVLGSGVYWVKP